MTTEAPGEGAAARQGDEVLFDASNAGDPAYWDEFASGYWAQKPVVLRKPFADPLVSDAQALQWLRTAFAPGAPSKGKEFLINRLSQDAPKAEHLPQPDESDIAAYTARLAKEAKLSNYQYVMYSLGRFDAEGWLSARAAMAPLVEKVGIPAGAFDTDCFFGEYHETAAGLHKDNAAVFSYVVHGTKTMLVWPFEYFEHETQQPNAIREKSRIAHVDYTQHLDAATILTGGPGDMLYWPATYWHIAVGDGKPQMTFNLSFYHPHPPRADIDEVFAMLVGPEISRNWVDFYPYSREQLQEQAQSIPDSWKSVVETYKKNFTSEKFAGMLHGAWLRRLTSGGFRTRPVLNPDTDLKASELFHGDASFPVVWVRLDGTEKVIVSANGGLFVAPVDGPVLEVVERTNSGQPFSAQSVADELAGGEPVPSGSVPAILTVMRKLLKFRALTREAPIS